MPVDLWGWIGFGIVVSVGAGVLLVLISLFLWWAWEAKLWVLIENHREYKSFIAWRQERGIPTRYDDDLDSNEMRITTYEKRKKK